MVEGEVSYLDVGEGRLRDVVPADGRRSDIGNVVVAPRFTARLDGFGGLGVETAELQLFGQVAGSHVVTGPQGAASVAGVYAAGSITSLTETARSLRPLGGLE
ncbi:hypothetical protein [Streptomyces sp. NPDC058664]|uniref:hypothetical protein n=1 Tax=unclassified Streptomyces TaxID=2593676 RepID=UPI003651B434